MTGAMILVICLVIVVVAIVAGLYALSGALQQFNSDMCPLPYGAAALNSEVDTLNQEGINASLETVGGIVMLVLPNDTLTVGWSC